MKILCDCHTHSNNSFDADNSVKEMCQSAVNKNVKILAITDHLEVPEISLKEKSIYGDMVKQIKKSTDDVNKCKVKFASELKLLKGVEIGEPMHNPLLTEVAMSIDNYDFVLASVHNLKDKQDFYFLQYDESNADPLLKEYFNELLDTALNADFDSLAHLTYPLRYITERTDIKVNIGDFSKIIDDIFKALISRNKALEINTSGLFKEIGSTLPGIDLVKRFKELGGKYITIGSDAHNTENVGKGIDNGIEIAKKCGFSHFTYFEGRMPKLVEI